MILHLDSGSCGSAIDMLDLNLAAAQCYQWRAYVDEDYRVEMLERVDLLEEYRDAISPFKCPGCNCGFKKLSGLFQHVSTPICGQTLESGAIAKLVRWLEKIYG